MIRKIPAVLAAVVALGGCAVIALALVEDLPKGQPVGEWYKTSGWPEGLKDLVNIDGRVSCSYSPSHDFFTFRVDAKAFTKFLERYAKLKDTPLRLIIHPGRGESPTWPGSKGAPIDWSLVTQSRAWREIGETGKKPTPRGYNITVDLYLGGNIDLKDLEVPLEIEVQSSGEIEKFIITHDAQRQLVKERADKDKAREKAAENAK
ncbi:MAG: hypothetical protein NTX87_19400 [Planctomycetota bacterium]|nr:hypothetical protein [Planctomycetota bacterium]